MSTETPTVLDELLNRLEAIIDCGAATVKELGKHLLPDQETRQSGIRVAEWIRSRAKQPKGDIALKMHSWAATKELEISKARGATKYREAYRKIQKRRSTPSTTATK